MTELRIPSDLLPHDGRFGSGPAKVRAEAMSALASSPLMGTSHRRTPVKSLVAHIQEQLGALYSLPSDYQVVLGDGGATLSNDDDDTTLPVGPNSSGGNLLMDDVKGDENEL